MNKLSPAGVAVSVHVIFPFLVITASTDKIPPLSLSHYGLVASFSVSPLLLKITPPQNGTIHRPADSQNDEEIGHLSSIIFAGKNWLSNCGSQWNCKNSCLTVVFFVVFSHEFQKFKCGETRVVNYCPWIVYLLSLSPLSLLFFSVWLLHKAAMSRHFFSPFFQPPHANFNPISRLPPTLGNR